MLRGSSSSTVLPGVTEERILPRLTAASGREPGRGLEIAFNPEFLREGSAVRDFFEPPLTVIGALRQEAIKTVEALYQGIEAPIYRTTPRVAEAIKYVSNSYHALKVTFANEIGTLLKALGIDSRAPASCLVRRPAPEGPDPGAVPALHGLGLDDLERLLPPRPPAPKQNPEDAVYSGQAEAVVVRHYSVRRAIAGLGEVCWHRFDAPRPICSRTPPASQHVY